MKRLLTIAAVVAVAGSVPAQTSLTQVWKVDVGTYEWFSTTSSTVRSARYNPGTDHVTVVSRDPNLGTSPSLAILDAATGAEISTLSLADTDGGYVRPSDGEKFTVMKHAHDANGVTYIGNLTLVWDQVEFKIYRLASETGPITVAYAGTRDDLSSGGITGNDPRIGDTFDVTGSGINTEIWAGLRRAAGPHLIRFTTTDGLTFTPTRELTIPGTWTLSTLPVYRGLSVMGTGDSAIIWIKDGNKSAYRINALTGAIEETVDTVSAFPLVYSHAGVKVFQEYGSSYLAFVPAALGTLAQQSAYVMQLSPNRIAAVTESLAATVPNTNSNGVGSVDYDPTRKNLIFLWTNNSVSAHNVEGSGLTAAKSWSLLP